MNTRAQIAAERKAKRSAYNKKHYQEHKEEIKERYNSQTKYIRWVDIKKTMNKHKREIGKLNYELLMEEFRKLDVSNYG